MINRKNRAVGGISRLDSRTVNYFAQPSTVLILVPYSRMFSGAMGLQKPDTVLQLPIYVPIRLNGSRAVRK